MSTARAQPLFDFDEQTISPYEEMLAYETLWALDGMTEAKLTALFKEFDDLPSKALKAYFTKSQPLFTSDEAYRSLRDQVDSFLKTKLGKFSISINRDFQYPASLRKAAHPIELFYYRGNLDLLSTKCISIVGARKATQEGLRRAAKLARGLVENQYTIVSGLAAGIDTSALAAAIDHNGKVIGVIGTPIDSYYPKENRELQDKIAQDHLLISQVPFYRYHVENFQNHKLYFPRRNVTMAAISEATVIVEASDTSGSLTQARACVSQGKKLFILESCFQNKDIKWPHTYEKQGAIRVKELSDILEKLQ